MKQLLITFALSTLFASAQQATANGVLVTFGIWPVCESASGPSIPACDGFQPGNELYLLLIDTTISETVAYKYTIKATLVGTGAPVSSAGVVERLDNHYGYTTTAINLGGLVSNPVITVQSLIPVTASEFRR